jgi:hypothetical protein
MAAAQHHLRPNGFRGWQGSEYDDPQFLNGAPNRHAVDVMRSVSNDTVVVGRDLRDGRDQDRSWKEDMLRAGLGKEDKGEFEDFGQDE